MAQIMPTVTKHEPPHDKTNKMTLRPAKTQINLGIHGCPGWSESYDKTNKMTLHPVKTQINLGIHGCPGWSESSLGTHAILLVLSWGSSHVNLFGLMQTMWTQIRCHRMWHLIKLFIICKKQLPLHVKVHQRHLFNWAMSRENLSLGFQPDKTQTGLLSYSD